jgi:MFS family permease
VSDLDDADRPATFREVLVNGEFRALYSAAALSWFGDYVAKAAVTALVFYQTRSVAESAATFAISYLPWLGLGPFLSALAERLPYRRTMVVTDVLRMVFIALVALPKMPIWGMIALLFAAAVCAPPFDAARSALLPKVLDGDRYVVGLTLVNTTVQAAQIAGYLAGALASSINPQAALAFNAATFGLSACLIGFGIRDRSSELTDDERSSLLHETVEGMQLVFGTPLLRAVALVVLCGSLFAVVPEGLAAAWAFQLTDGGPATGWVQGVIMISNPVGFVLGGLAVGRFLSPGRRRRLIPIFAIGVPVALVPALFNPGATVVYAVSFVSGVVAAGLVPPTNALFVQALPDAYRARAFGVMKSGMQVLQGIPVFVTGWLADHYFLPKVVGLWGLAGVGLMTIIVVVWPRREEIDAEVARVKELNAARSHRIVSNAPTVELSKATILKITDPPAEAKHDGMAGPARPSPYGPRNARSEAPLAAMPAPPPYPTAPPPYPTAPPPYPTAPPPYPTAAPTAPPPMAVPPTIASPTQPRPGSSRPGSLRDGPPSPGGTTRPLGPAQQFSIAPLAPAQPRTTPPPVPGETTQPIAAARSDPPGETTQPIVPGEAATQPLGNRGPTGPSPGAEPRPGRHRAEEPGESGAAPGVAHRAGTMER